MGITIQKVTDESFRKYGRIVDNIDFKQLVQTLNDKTPLTDAVVYEPSVRALEELPVYGQLTDIGYGELPIQIGFCNGRNVQLNALEYHRSSEIDVAGNDLILLLGQQRDITPEYTYDTSNVEAFLLPAGVGVELYATTLHYAPCSVSEEGFRCVIVLPKDTNLPLDKEHEAAKNGAVFSEDRLITAKNKWLLGHAQGGLDAGCHIGLTGENISVK